MNTLKQKIKKIVPQLAGTQDHWQVSARMNFTDPNPGRLYVKILNVLKAQAGLTIDELYGQIPGTELRYSDTHDWQKGRIIKKKYWVNKSVLTALVAAGLVTRTGIRYSISKLGVRYLKMIAAKLQPAGQSSPAQAQ